MVKFSKIGAFAATGAAAAVFALALTGCQGASSVAATVNGTDISEDKVTEYITNLRNNYGYSSEEDWANYLLNMDTTPAELRDDVVDMLVSQELVKQQVDKYGISPDSSEVDAFIAAMKDNFESDAAWEQALREAKTTEEKYREALEDSIGQDRLSMYFESVAEPEQKDIDSMASSYSTYYSGSKKVAHILFDYDDADTAKDVIEQLQSGDITFEEAVKKYSKDDVTKDSGGVIGWTRIDTFPTAIMDALDNMEKGDVSEEPIETVYGIHVITVVDDFVIEQDEDGYDVDIESVSELPDELQDLIKTRTALSDASTKYSEWLEQITRESDIVKNCMPEKAKYDVDLQPYREAKEAEEAAEQAASETADDSTSSSVGEDGTIVSSSSGDDGSIVIGDEGISGEVGEDGTIVLDGEEVTAESGSESSAE